ncbi:MAG: vanadium-dependent haloperoxidase [Gemmatimonadaceae bacterium]
MIRSRLLAASLLAAALLLESCSRPAPADPRMVAAWMQAMYGAFRVERVSPPVASRLLVYSTAALYSGLAAADPQMKPLGASLNRFPVLPAPEKGVEYDATFLSVAAERVVMDSLLHEGLPTTRAAMNRLADSLEAARLKAGARDATRARSEELGRRIGLGIVEWSRTDGFTATRGRKYLPPAGPGLWVNDAPGNTFAQQNLSGASEFVGLDNPANIMKAGTVSDRGLILNRPKRAGLATLPPVNMSGMSEPYWGEVKPFVLNSWNECAIPAPYAYSADSAADAYHDAMAVYRTRAGLTPDQRAIALYWADNAGESGTPVGHWISIASQMVSEKNMNAPDAARTMVLTASAMADAFIASWGYKYQHNFLRPRPYIRAMIDSTWEPLIATPPFPEYPSGHSTQSAAAATVLTSVLGTIAFEDSTGLSIGSPVRHFTSFDAAAEEAGMSRVYGGIHFPNANVNGRRLGQCIGHRVVERFTATSKP